MPNPKVGVVLVNYNGTRDTLECVQSLERQSIYHSIRIVVVENGSRPEKREELLAALKPHRVDLVFVDQNQGFAPGNNRGLHKALDLGCEYVFQLNNDTILPEWRTIELLVRDAQELRAKTGKEPILGCKIVYHTEPDKVWFLDGSMNYTTGRVDHVPAPRRAWAYEGLTKSGFITGCALLAHRSVWLDVGPVPQDYFLNGEDAEWAHHAKKKGYAFYVDRGITINHKVLPERKAEGGKEYYYNTRSNLRLSKRMLGPRFVLTGLPYHLYRAAWMVAHDIKHKKWERARYVTLGVRDFFLGRSGPAPAVAAPPRVPVAGTSEAA